MPNKEKADGLSVGKQNSQETGKNAIVDFYANDE